MIFIPYEKMSLWTSIENLRWPKPIQIEMTKTNANLSRGEALASEGGNNMWASLMASLLQLMTRWSRDIFHKVGHFHRCILQMWVHNELEVHSNKYTIKSPPIMDTMFTPRSIGKAHVVFSARVFDRACHN